MRFWQIFQYIPLIRAFLGEIDSKKARRLNERIAIYGGRVETLQAVRKRFTACAQEGTAFTMDKDEVQFFYKLAKKIT